MKIGEKRTKEIHYDNDTFTLTIERMKPCPSWHRKSYLKYYNCYVDIKSDSLSFSEFNHCIESSKVRESIEGLEKSVEYYVLSRNKETDEYEFMKEQEFK